MFEQVAINRGLDMQFVYTVGLQRVKETSKLDMFKRFSKVQDSGVLNFSTRKEENQHGGDVCLFTCFLALTRL